MLSTKSRNCFFVLFDNVSKTRGLKEITDTFLLVHMTSNYIRKSKKPEVILLVISLAVLMFTSTGLCKVLKLLKKTRLSVKKFSIWNDKIAQVI